VITRIRQSGFSYSLQILFNRLVPEWLFRCRRFTVFVLPSRIDFVDVENVSAEWADPSADEAIRRQLERFPTRVSGGSNRVCVARRANNLAGFVWCASRHFDETELGLRIVLPPHQYWIYSAYVLREYRRRGVYRQLLACVTRDLHHKDPQAQLLLAINPDNRQSVAAHTAFGVQPQVRVFALRLGRIAGCRVKPAGGCRAALNRSWSRDWKRHPLLLEIGNQPQVPCSTSSLP
jgi:ribosomal protein S18 acetylase RimI-like enzyme